VPGTYGARLLFSRTYYGRGAPEVMIFALIYLTISLIVYMAMFRFILRQGKETKTQYQHPEMKEVRPGDPLLVVKFDGPPSTLRPEQSPDLGWNEFLANRNSGNRDNDDT